MSTAICKKCNRVNQVPEEDLSETVSFLRATRDFSCLINGQLINCFQAGIIDGAIVSVLKDSGFPVVPLKRHEFIVCQCRHVTHLKAILI